MTEYAVIAAAVALAVFGAYSVAGSFVACEFVSIDAFLRGAEFAVCILE